MNLTSAAIVPPRDPLGRELGWAADEKLHESRSTGNFDFPRRLRTPVGVERSARPSLPEVFGSIPVAERGFWRKLLAFSGPGLLVAVGYMDPGNWATDLAGGARYGYTLLSVVFLSNLLAMLLQHLALKLGIVAGRDLAQACRDHFSRPTSFMLWVLCEVAIAACDLAEVIGSALALKLLFNMPLGLGRAADGRRCAGGAVFAE